MPTRVPTSSRSAGRIARKPRTAAPPLADRFSKLLDMGLGIDSTPASEKEREAVLVGSSDHAAIPLGATDLSPHDGGAPPFRIG